MRRRESEGGALPGRTIPEVVVEGALQCEGRTVDVEAHASGVVGRTATEGCRHGGRTERTPGGRRRDGRRNRCGPFPRDRVVSAGGGGIPEAGRALSCVRRDGGDDGD